MPLQEEGKLLLTSAPGRRGFPSDASVETRSTCSHVAEPGAAEEALLCSFLQNHFAGRRWGQVLVARWEHRILIHVLYSPVCPLKYAPVSLGSPLPAPSAQRGQ